MLTVHKAIGQRFQLSMQEFDIIESELIENEDYVQGHLEEAHDQGSLIEGEDVKHAPSGKTIEWSYSGENGPDFWHRSFPVAASDYQSPINIESDCVVFDPRLSPLVFSGYQSYFDGEPISLTNNGRTVKLSVESPCCLTRADLRSVYDAQYVCFHWGSRDEVGSEHQRNGKSYPMEIQIVHRNRKYSCEEMCDKLDGILILAILAEIGNLDHEGVQNISDKLERIKYQGQEVYITKFPLDSLLPVDTSRYYHYVGSLTSPPCNECVTWIVLHDTIRISKSQLDQFRQLRRTPRDCASDVALLDNFRPTQPLRRRKVYASFRQEESFVEIHSPNGY